MIEAKYGTAKALILTFPCLNVGEGPCLNVGKDRIARVGGNKGKT